MLCLLCGGECYWQGPATNLTHTLCANCGAINQHTPESEHPCMIEDHWAFGDPEPHYTGEDGQ